MENYFKQNKILKKNTTIIGQKAEDLVSKFLLTKGYKYIDKNVRYKFGEIDLIMKDNDEIVFIEVRSSTGDNPLLEYSLNFNKLKRFRKAIEFYRFINKVELPCRVDVVWVKYLNTIPKIDHLQNVMV